MRVARFGFACSCKVFMYYYALQRKWFLPTDMAEKDRCDHPRTLPNPTLFKVM